MKSPRLMMEKMSSEGGPNSGSPMEIKTRKKFPETWLWQTVTTDETGKTELDDLVVPDTITSWILTGFSMSTETGLGVVNGPEKITAFQKFFIKLYLPYSIKQNEDVLVKAVVYNYLDADVTVTVSLADNEMFEFLAGSNSSSRQVKIPKDDALQVAWPVKATKIGSLPIKVRAVVDGNLAGDEIQKVLIVKPEGIKKTKIFNGLIKGGETDVFDVSFPQTVVPGSQRLEIRLFGDIMANSLSNIDELLKMPYGCGEQNMINFAPAVFIYRYLLQTSQSTPEIEAKALKIIETGYQRQLKYRHTDGGFSAFGEGGYHKANASTLLSSFVLKCFRAANDLLPKKAIDDSIIDFELEFLAGKMTKDGNFREDGRVFSSYLMSGINKNGNIAVTAYTLIAFLETELDEGKLEEIAVAQTALDTLANNYEKVEDSHTLALIAYALTLGGNPAAELAMNKLLAKSRENSGTTEWLVEKRWGGEQVSVEIGAYALLVYAARGLDETEDEALPIFRGITKQLSESGGFASTQDTVIGIQALAKFAEFMTVENMNVQIVLALDGVDRFTSKTISNENKNLALIDQIDIEDSFSEGIVKLSSAGEGSVFSQVVAHWHESDYSQDPFELEAELVDRFSIVKRDTDSAPSRDNFCIRITTKATDNADKRVADGMSLVMVEHASGYSYEKFEHEDSSTPQKIESDSDKTTLYYDDLANVKTGKMCFTKTESVSNPKPISITVQDYYNPEARSTRSQSLDSLAEADFCSLCSGAGCGDIPACPDGPSKSAVNEAPSKPTRPIKSKWIKSTPTNFVLPEFLVKWGEENQIKKETLIRYVKTRIDDMKKSVKNRAIIPDSEFWESTPEILESFEQHFLLQGNILKNILRDRN